MFEKFLAIPLSMRESPILSPAQTEFFNDVKTFFFSNPFGDTSFETLKKLLGPEFNPISDQRRIEDLTENRERLCDKIERHLGDIDKLVHGANKPLRPDDYRLYEPAVFCIQFHRNREAFQGLIGKSKKALKKRGPFHSDIWGDSLEDQLNPGGIKHQPSFKTEHLIALFYQLHRAESFIISNIPGRTASAGALRTRIWQSIFTRNLERYFIAIHATTRSAPTLITGPTGSRKDRIAETIALSQYIPFDASSSRFEARYNSAYTKIDLAAIHGDLFDHTVFGYRRNSASTARSALDFASRWGSLFLDHLHQAPLSIQARLTHLIHSGHFHFLDGGEAQPFSGKLIAASKDGIKQTVIDGSFSEDLFLAISADRIGSLPLLQAISENTDELAFYVEIIAGELTEDVATRQQISDESIRWIRRHVSPAYMWPGNYRELEQCVRNIMIHGDFTLNTTLEHTGQSAATDPFPPFVHSMLSGQLPYDELLHHYFKIVVEREGGYAQAARAIGVDQRTVKKYYRVQLK